MEIYTRWEILIAWMPSSDGTPPLYPHPCIYLSDSAKIQDGVVLIGITSDPTTTLDEDTVVMPYARGKHQITGLDRPSFAKVGAWTRHIERRLARQVIGFTPPKQQKLILNCLWRMKQRSR